MSTSVVDGLLDLRYKRHLFQLFLKGFTIYIRVSTETLKVSKGKWIFKDLIAKVRKEKLSMRVSLG